MKVLLFFLAIGIGSCSFFKKNYTTQEIVKESKRFNDFLDMKFEEMLAKYPEYQTYLGRKTNYDKLDDVSEKFSEKEYKAAKRNLKDLSAFDKDSLDDQSQVSFELYRRSLEKHIEDYKWRYHYYPVNQMFGIHSGLVSFMINFHTISNEKEAVAYIRRLQQFGRVLQGYKKFITKSAGLGIIPPEYVFSKVQNDIENIVTGYPYTKKAKDNTLYSDFKKKLNKLKLNSKKKVTLKNEIKKVLANEVKPAYIEFSKFFAELQPRSKGSRGAWHLPNGAEYYRLRLKRQTTTDYSPAKIHEIGLLEVAKIHKEMEGIKEQVGFKGSLKQFFTHMKRRKDSYYPNTMEGRSRYIKDTNKIIVNVQKKIPELFNILPKAKLRVKAVEAYREKSAGRAFYEGPALDGSRPGTYYVNLYDLKTVPKYEAEALAYHEALPGHHMQISIAQELESLPMFRRQAHYTAYSEGWGLYSEKLPKEIGFYKDPYSDFGRLSMELWRACRLVVDTGIHYKRWTKEQGIQYLNENAPNDAAENLRAIERYIVMPGQATAYKIGQLKILELRKRVKKAQGKKFDIKSFHDEVLKHGAVPLDILEKLIEKKFL